MRHLFLKTLQTTVHRLIPSPEISEPIDSVSCRRRWCKNRLRLCCMAGKGHDEEHFCDGINNRIRKLAGLIGKDLIQIQQAGPGVAGSLRQRRSAFLSAQHVTRVMRQKRQITSLRKKQTFGRKLDIHIVKSHPTLLRSLFSNTQPHSAFYWRVHLCLLRRGPDQRVQLLLCQHLDA